MLGFFKKKNRPNQEPERIRTTRQDIEQAILQFEKNLPHGVKRTVLVDNDKRIITEKLAPYLGGIPIENYYMSKETYEIFTEEDKLIPYYLDTVQAAVDDYMEEHNKLPIIPDDRDGRVHVDLLVSQYYLKEKPPIPLYITNEEFMITHLKND